VAADQDHRKWVSGEKTDVHRGNSAWGQYLGKEIFPQEILAKIRGSNRDCFCSLCKRYDQQANSS
jgi:hypothetical protein